MGIISEFGLFWARNEKNVRHLRHHLRSGSSGVYVLYNGSAPVEIGKGHLRSRISEKNRRKGDRREFWDHFSWFLINDKGTEHELEALLMSALPFYLRIFTRQDAGFLSCKPCKEIDPETYLRMPRRISRFHRHRKTRKS